MNKYKNLHKIEDKQPFLIYNVLITKQNRFNFSTSIILNELNFYEWNFNKLYKGYIKFYYRIIKLKYSLMIISLLEFFLAFLCL